MGASVTARAAGKTNGDAAQSGPDTSDTSRKGALRGLSYEDQLRAVSPMAGVQGPMSEHDRFVAEVALAKQQHDISWVGSLPSHVVTDIDREYSVEKASALTRKERAALKADVKKALEANPEYVAMKPQEKRATLNKAVQAATVIATGAKSGTVALEVVKPRSMVGRDAETLVNVPSSGVTRLEGREVARLNFVAAMKGVFGDEKAVQGHFAAIRSSSAPGGPLLHDAPAEALARAAAAFESRYPGYRFASTSVAFALRNRHHSRQGPGMLGHVLGVSLDYQAYDNPHLKDAKRRLLMETVGGGPTHLEFAARDGREMGYGKRREIIAKLAVETQQHGANMPVEERHAEGQRVLGQLDGAYDRMVATSNNLKGSLGDREGDGAAALAELKAAGEQYWGSRKQIKAAERRVSKADKNLQRARKKTRAKLERERARVLKKSGPEAAGPGITDAVVDAHESVVAARAQVEAASQELTALTAGITETMNRVLKPWHDKIDAQLAELAAAVGVSVGSAPPLATVQKAYKSLRWAKGKRLQKLLRETYAELFGGWEPGLADDKALREAALERLNGMAKLGLLGDMRRRLETDLDLVFGAKSKTVSDPGMLQLIDKGFIRDDAMPDLQEAAPEGEGGETKKPAGRKARQPVFNREFVRCMMEHGFEPAAAWSTADSMHFDYVPSFSVFAGRSGVDYGPKGAQKRD